jgi:hypothetical protein
VRSQIDCTGGFDALPTTFEIVATGYPDYELRESSRAAKEHAGAVPFLSHRYRISSGSFALQKQRATSVAALDQDFTWQAQGDLVGPLSYLPGKSDNSAHEPSNTQLAVLRPSFWLPREWDLALNQRKSALFLNQGYPLTIDEQLEFALPLRSRVNALPRAAASTQGPLKWNIKWSKPSDSKLRVTLNAELSTGELSNAETASLQQLLRALLNAANTAITFEH